MSSDIRKIFDFTTFLEGFKKIERFVGQHFWKDYPFPKRYESTADHTWRMAMLLVLLEHRLSQPFDFKKAMKMLLIHDVPEMITGDASPLGTDGTGRDSHAYDKKAAYEKFQKEKAAAQKIFGKLPDSEGDELLTLWLELENKTSYEAKVVNAIDKFEGKLQAFEYTKGVMFKDHFDFSMKYGVVTFDVDPALEELGAILSQTLEENYQEFQK